MEVRPNVKNVDIWYMLTIWWLPATKRLTMDSILAAKCSQLYIKDTDRVPHLYLVHLRSKLGHRRLKETVHLPNM